MKHSLLLILRISNVFSKALSLAGVVYEAKWDAKSYLSFINENGFEIVESKQLPSTIQLIYTECVLKKEKC